MLRRREDRPSSFDEQGFGGTRCPSVPCQKILDLGELPPVKLPGKALVNVSTDLARRLKYSNKNSPITTHWLSMQDTLNRCLPQPVQSSTTPKVCPQRTGGGSRASLTHQQHLLTQRKLALTRSARLHN